MKKKIETFIYAFAFTFIYAICFGSQYFLVDYPKLESRKGPEKKSKECEQTLSSQKSLPNHTFTSPSSAGAT